jgi:hypothetical protein
MSPKMKDLEYREEFSLFGQPMVDDFGDGGQRKFHGLYRGAVVSNVDPEFRGRIMARVTDVTGIFTTSWAEPVVPFAGPNAGYLSVPPINAGVWIEFENGDPDKPVWLGGLWGSTIEAPVTAKTIGSTGPAGAATLIQSMDLNFICIADKGMFAGLPTGGILISAGPGTTIMIDKTGIKMTAPSVMINGATVTFNGGALVIT